MTARVLERLRKGPDEDERLARLTDQEREVLNLLSEGLTNRQIGERLHLAEKTIKNYVTVGAVQARHVEAHRGGGVRGTAPQAQAGPMTRAGAVTR